MLDYKKMDEAQLYKRFQSADLDIRGPAQAEIERRRGLREDAKFATQLTVSKWAAGEGAIDEPNLLRASPV